jgi:predicted phage-related endonuclease
MAIERIPVDPIKERAQWLALRQQDVTASTIASLFGLHPYVSALQLWCEKTGLALPELGSSVLERGRFYEGAVADGFRAQHPTWTVTKPDVYVRDPVRRIGATPDFLITTDDGRHGVLQVKTVAPDAFRRYWTEEVAPTWISLQCLTEAMLDEADFGMIAALVIDPYRVNPPHEYEVPRHNAAEDRIRGAVENFWKAIEAGEQPKPDYTRDRAILSVMFPREKPKKIIDLRGNNRLPELLETRETLKARIKKAEADLETAEAEIVHLIGDAENALVNGWKVTFKEQHRKEHVVRATSFRVLRSAREQHDSAP